MRSLTAALFTIGSLICTANGSVILNGSFESQALGSPGRIDISNLDSWSASGGFILLERGINGTSNIAATDGGQFLSFGHSGNIGGTIAQVFSTTVGQQYMITLDLASIQGGAAQTIETRVYDETANALIDSAASQTPAINNLWVQGNSLLFTAVSASSRIELQHTFGSNTANVVLDNVKVSAVPEPSSALLFGLGVLGLTTLRRRTR